MGKVYLKTKYDNEMKMEIPHNHNFASAMFGFREMAAEIVPYHLIDDIYDDFKREDIALDYIDQCNVLFNKFGVTPHIPDYPDVLKPFLGRKIWKDTINSISRDENKWSAGYFVKPAVRSKAFTGKTISSIKDLMGCGNHAEDYEVLVSESLDIAAEWRCFITYDEIIDVRPYGMIIDKSRKGYLYHYDAQVLNSMMESFVSWEDRPKSERLTIEPAILDLVDPVKPRRDVRDYLRVILERLEKVQEDELAKADSIMATIKENFGTTDVDDEDIEDMVEKIVEFYRTAEDGKLPGKYDQELFDEVKKYSTSTSKAIKEIVVAQKTSNALDCIMAFSQDPIRKVEKLDQLLKKVTADIVKIQAELEVRKAKLGGGSNPSGSENVFENEKTIISECSAILESLEGAVC